MSRWATAILAGVLIVASADARDTARHVSTRHVSTPHWMASWGSSQMIAEGDNALPADRAAAVTLRQIIRLSAGGDRVRVRLSNAFGTQPLAIGSARIARTSAPATPQVGGGAALTFAGQAGAIIPAGAELYSDPVAMPVAPGADVAISLYLPEAAVPQTGHPGARAFSYTLAGDHVADPGFAGAKQTTHWYTLADLEVSGATTIGANTGTIVAIGDSITDGYGVKPNHNTRWTDILAERLRGTPATRGIGVVNAGIGGNRILLDGLGPNLMARFDRDVVARSGVRWAILLEGVNDLGVLTREAPATPAQHAAIVAQVTGAYTQLVARAHTHGITMIGSTITPFGGNDYYHPGPATEADRQAINTFIRTSGTFDAVIDFDRVMRDPEHPDRLAPAYDSGDHLHPSEAGYRKMGEAVPLTLFGKATRQVIGAVAPVPVAPVPLRSSADTRPAIALTFDDIPAHGPLAPGQTRADVIRGITTALAAARAPAFGFMNAGFGLDNPADAAAAIAAWRTAGLPLGNHTYSHGDLAKVGASAFVADIVRNEAPLARVAKGTDWHWFRYPFLSEGKSIADRDAVRNALKARGYRVAAVTMSFDDYNWNPPYAACAAKRDPAAIATLETGYLAAARTAALASRARAKAQLGHDIPYVLLMHVGAFDARMLPRLLSLYASMGFRFVTLAEAETDPYYAAATDLTRPTASPSLQGPPSVPAPVGPPAGLCA
ncbi:lysophospholipase L1-like esterase [Sphingomonas sp. PP-F2F-G114-C0414]|uniref:GDSL-type esterase/lipase family protein n=1 Tax=Sphingomonas sp. PP-F2F-G114-C0414 TaxID=2135662 RepID=UPI000EF86CF3|nr:GDSL-type esterase/lipase family protein [Sphingomonas sp. PP-F2F-G114-C0414]RMB28361.1 lysophospholipase L1-like esterase [Sphingomonas sp. PP-F2F-G114-C0414]